MLTLKAIYKMRMYSGGLTIRNKFYMRIDHHLLQVNRHLFECKQSIQKTII